MNGCPHCAKEKLFLEKISQKYSDKLEIISLEVTENRKNARVMKKVGKELNVRIPGVPFTVVGKSSFIGWDKEETTGSKIEKSVQQCISSGCEDIVQKYLFTVFKSALTSDSIPEKIHVPLIGEVETKDLSLPVMTVLIAALDGFNPCAMWVLLFLISLLLGMENRKRRWILGFSFLVASALVYFLFMAAWLNLFLFIGFVTWIRIFIGLIALFASYYYFKQFIVNPQGACDVSEGEKKKKIFDKIKEVIEKKNIMISLIGIIVLSFTVNLVELICSAGLPVIYTQTLVANNLPLLSYYLYISLYILVFLLDDVIVFVVAMITLQVTGFTTRFTHISHFVGGILLLVIGLFMIFKPEYLMFG